MDKEIKLVKKVKHLLRRLGCPRWLHHFGPKKYEFLDHLTALLIRAFSQLSYRRVKILLDSLGIKCPTKSSLQRTAKKLSAAFWQRILQITCGSSYMVALDSTGLSRTNPSYYYLKRIDGAMPKIPVKLSVAFNTKKKKFAAAKIRVLPAHELRDAQHLLKYSNPKVMAADKAYDSNRFHNYCAKNNIKAYIPIRKWSKPKHRSWSARQKAARHFNNRVYHRRELVESAFSSIKRKYGTAVTSRSVRAIRTEIYSRLVCHNLIFWFIQRFGTLPSSPQPL